MLIKTKHEYEIIQLKEMIRDLEDENAELRAENARLRAEKDIAPQKSPGKFPLTTGERAIYF